MFVNNVSFNGSFIANTKCLYPEKAKTVKNTRKAINFLRGKNFITNSQRINVSKASQKVSFQNVFFFTLLFIFLLPCQFAWTLLNKSFTRRLPPKLQLGYKTHNLRFFFNLWEFHKTLLFLNRKTLFAAFSNWW